MVCAYVCTVCIVCIVCMYVWYGMVWYGMVWYGMVWYGMVWYGMVWYGMVWYGMVWYGMYVCMCVYGCTGVRRFVGLSCNVRRCTVKDVCTLCLVNCSVVYRENGTVRPIRLR